MNPARSRGPRLGSLALVAVLLAAACADRNEGQPIPGDRLAFPLGIRALTADDGGNLLAVVSSNFDQRYQTAQITLMDADQLIDGVLEALAVPSPTADACAAAPLYVEDFDLGGRRVLLDRVRVPGGAGERAVVPGADGRPDRLYTADRFGSQLVLVERRDRTLSCAREGEEPVRNTDCTPSHTTLTEAEDPFDLSVGELRDGRRYVGVGHLFPYRLGQLTAGQVTLLDEEILAAKARGESVAAPEPCRTSRSGRYPDRFGALVAPSGIPGPEGLVPPSRSADESFCYGFRLDGSSGVGALAHLPGGPPDRPSFVALTASRGTRFEAAAVELDDVEAEVDVRLGSESSTVTASVPATLIDAISVHRVRLDLFTNATRGRGAVLLRDPGDPAGPARVLVSVQFTLPRVGRSSGLGVLRRTEDGFDTQAFLDLGEELGDVSVLPPERPGDPELAFVGDGATDLLYVVDVTRDDPAVATVIDGRGPRTLIGDEELDRRLLDGPAYVAFVRRGGRTFGFVTNFANSTLSVLELSSPQPSDYCVLARLGRDSDANGESERDRL